MNKNDGTSLEQLVALIEGQLSPAGFKVEVRKPVFDDQGVQVAEFDIAISGSVGTSELSWLIECRDRPSDGAAPGEWIEQLVGRRSRFRFDKVMAVSSTGFSPGAVDAAKSFGIDLRHMQSLTDEEVADWLPLNAPMNIHKGLFSAVRVFVVPPGDPREGASEQFFGPDDKVFIGQTSGEEVSVPELWQRVVNNSALWKDVPEDGTVKATTVSAQEYLPEQYCMRIDGESLPIDSIEFDATLQVIVPKMPLVEAAEYSTSSLRSGEKRTFARVGRWRSLDEGPIKQLTFIGFLRRKKGDDTT